VHLLVSEQYTDSIMHGAGIKVIKHPRYCLIGTQMAITEHRSNVLT